MIVRHLYLQNYRVYENVTELDLPEGLVGIYGPNGAGKSYLIEAIPFALFGHARGPIDEVRTTGVNDECVVEVHFEHEQHTYVARRSLKGGGKTLKHEAFVHCDGLQVATGARDVGRYIQQVIGMNDKGFLASVFAEQKQLAALSAQAPGERRKLVLDLLGITPIEAAVKTARRDAKEAQALLESIQEFATDLDELETKAGDTAAAAVAAEAEQIAAEAAETVAREVATAAAEAHAAISNAIQDGRRIKEQFDKLNADAEKLAAEATALSAAQSELDALGDTATALDAARRTVDLVRAVATATATHARAAQARADAGPVESGSAEPPDDTAAVAAREAAATAAEALAGLKATAAALANNAADAEANLARTDELAGDADCPTCGQPLGDTFAEVRAHRVAELEARQQEAKAAAAAARAAAADAKSLAEAAAAAEAELKAARAAWQAAARARETHGKLRAAEQAARDALAAAETAAADVVAVPLADAEAALAAADAANGKAQHLTGQLARAKVVATELAAAQAARDELGRDLEARRADAKAKGYTPDGLRQAEQRRTDTAAAAEAATKAARDALEAKAHAAATAQAAETALARAREQHARIEPQKIEARLLGRLGELLNAFKDHEAASVGPRLAGHARALFSDMTEGTYDNLELSDSFEVRITDQNRTFDLKRFSGSEVDLANLALRIAISECVTLQSGGAVGLLVLDEVFGPLDASRRMRLLQALNSLQTRFRQVLVVTHADDVKAQLPSAVEVRPIGDRRSTATVG